MILIIKVKGGDCIHEVESSYLNRFINADKLYPVDYTIKQNGEKIFKPSLIKGSDLTQNQIVELFLEMNI